MGRGDGWWQDATCTPLEDGSHEHGDRAAGVQLDIRIIMAGANHVLDTDTSTKIL